MEQLRARFTHPRVNCLGLIPWGYFRCFFKETHQYGENLRVLLTVQPEAKCEKDPTHPRDPTSLQTDRQPRKIMETKRYRDTQPGRCVDTRTRRDSAPSPPPRSFLLFLLFLLVILVLLGGLGGQRAHSVADGLVVGVHPWQVFQNTLEEFRILHHIIIVFFLRKGSGGGCHMTGLVWD